MMVFVSSIGFWINPALIVWMAPLASGATVHMSDSQSFEVTADELAAILAL